MVDRLTDEELLELRSLHAAAQAIALDAEAAITAARRAQLTLQSYTFEVEAAHDLLGQSAQINIVTGEIKPQEEAQES